MEDAAAIVVIGNEILTGKVVDSNSPFLISELRALGVLVRRLHVIPDEIPVIAEMVRGVAERYRHVLTCGGVGPTLDDLTFEGIAQGFGVPLVANKELEKVIRNHFREKTLESHLKMARLPAGSELVWTSELPWPGTFVRNVCVLPGDPTILRKKFHAVKERFRSRPFFLRRLFTTMEEGALSPHLDAVFAAHTEILVGSYPVYDRPDYSVQVTLEGREAAPVEAALQTLLSLVDPKTLVRVE